MQETALNHVWVSGLLGDGFGATHGMERNHLAWVVTRMQVRVDEYPVCKPSHLLKENYWCVESPRCSHVFGESRKWML